MTDITTWIDEYHKGSRFGLNGKILIKKNSKYQEIIAVSYTHLTLPTNREV